MIILLSKFRVTKISVSYITGEVAVIGSSFIRQKYFCLPTEIAVLPTEAWNRISGGGVSPPPPHTHTHTHPVAPALTLI
jgi:hypothetical protein